MMNKLWLYHGTSSRRGMLPTELSRMWKCAVFVVCLLMISSTTAGAYDEPEAHWERKNSTTMEQTIVPVHVYIAGSVGYFGATWIPARGVWEFNFRMAGVGEARWDDSYGGDPANYCAAQDVIITETVNKDHQAIWTSNDKRYIGAWPHSGDDAYYYDVAYEIASFAISTINSYAGFALSAVELVYSLLSASDREEDGETVKRSWDYPLDNDSDVGCWLWWLVDVDPDQTVEFTVEDSLIGAFGRLPVNWGFRLVAPDTPERMSGAEREMYGIEEIPISALRERADELCIAPETVEELVEGASTRGESIVYYAHNLPVVEIP